MSKRRSVFAWGQRLEGLKQKKEIFGNDGSTYYGDDFKGVIHILIHQTVHFTHVHVTQTACHHTSMKLLKNVFSGTFLMVQQSRIDLPKEGTWVLSLAWEPKILHASEQLSPGATCTEACALWSLYSASRAACTRNSHTAMRSGPHSQQLERA